MSELFSFGESYPDLEPHHLKAAMSKGTLAACMASGDYDLRGLRYLLIDDDKVVDIIEVDCLNDQVPSRNSFGIRTREPLALVFADGCMPEVRALRKDFPRVPHLNYVPEGQPASLCLYFEPWSAVQRTWTPQKHLWRILWWLSETAKGELHKEDQQVERLYFNSPFEIVLPPDFDSKIQDRSWVLTFARMPEDSKTVRGFFFQKDRAGADKTSSIEILMLELPPVVHGPIERYPKTLGELGDQFEKRGLSLIDELVSPLRQKAPPQGLVPVSSSQCLLILTVPVKRTVDRQPERYEVRAFLLDVNLAALGQATGVLTKMEGRFYAVPLLGDMARIEVRLWRNIGLFPIEVKKDVTKHMAHQTSGITEETSDFKGVLAGVGALGSALADLWAKEYWGEWTLIDSDLLKPHNVIRHIARSLDSGRLKVNVVKEIMEANYHPGYYSVTAIGDNATNWTNNQIEEAITNAYLVVDATTTLEVPRDLSQRDDIPRCLSIFLTPSGQSSALLLESADRKVRLDSLEAQYYQAIISSEWGESHLSGHAGNLWVGAGCRDISAIISEEIILLHAAILGRQIRLLREQSEPCIRIWSVVHDTGKVSAHNLSVHQPVYGSYGNWRVMWDKGVEQRIIKMRNAHLPSETGGVIVGYIDHKIQSIVIVDVLQAPPDSEADQTGFIRGVKGLRETLDEIARRTANIVGYLGEWHSHPSFVSAYPSPVDQGLVRKLAHTRALEGEPALMVIVGLAGELSVTVKECC